MGWLAYVGLWFGIAVLLDVIAFAWEAGWHGKGSDDWDDEDVKTVIIASLFWPLILLIAILAGPVWLMYQGLKFLFAKAKKILKK